MSSGLETQWVFSIFTAPIMIPLFFAVSGDLFNDCDGDSRIFVEKIFKKLVVPWIGLACGKPLAISLIRRSSSYF